MPRIQVPIEYLSKLTKDQQINELNTEVRCTLAPSPIHGIGVFATRDIPRGQRCYCTPNVIPKFYNIPYGSLSKLFPEVKQIVLQRWASVVNGSIFCSPNSDAHLLMFINHTSDSEKLNYDVISDTALRDISYGEELLEDYRMMDNWQKVYSWIDTEKGVCQIGKVYSFLK